MKTFWNILAGLLYLLALGGFWGNFEKIMGGQRLPPHPGVRVAFLVGMFTVPTGLLVGGLLCGAAAARLKRKSVAEAAELWRSGAELKGVEAHIRTETSSAFQAVQSRQKGSVGETRLRTGACSACRSSPVAFGAESCPNCGARNPNPGIAYRFAGRGMLIGAAAGALICGTIGWHLNRADMGIGAALAGALLGVVVGLVAGLPVGLAAAFAAWLSGKR